MTPAEACALLERHQGMWPEWATGVSRWCNLLVMKSDIGPVSLTIGKAEPRVCKVRVRPGLPDEENVRRIIAAAEKGYHQRQRQAEKKRNPGVMSANRLAVSQLKKSGAARWFETKQPNGRGTS